MFKDNLGAIRNFKATLTVNENTKPVFRKARLIPFAMMDTIGKELDQLEQEDILKKVNHSEWAALLFWYQQKMANLECVGIIK